MKKVYSLFFTVAFFATSVCAQQPLPIYEPFAGTVGTLAGQNGWTGTAGVGNGAQVQNTPLTYPGLAAGPASNAILYGNQTSGGTQGLGFPTQTSKMYASFLVQLPVMPPALVNGSYNFGFSNGSFAGCMYAFPNANGTTFGLGFNGTNTVPSGTNRTDSNFALNSAPILVVMAYTPGAAGAGTVSVWVNPAASSFGGVEPTPTFSNIPGGNIATVSSVFIRSGSGTRSMIFDELRVARYWSEVTSTLGYVPTPLPLYDPFAGTSGSLAGQNGWSGDFATGAGAQVVNAPLTYPGLTAAPVSNAVSFGSQTVGGTQALGFPTQASKVYASFLVQLPTMPIALANGSYNFGFGSTNAGGTFAGCMYAFPNANGTTFGLGFNGTNTVPSGTNRTDSNFALNSAPILVVMAYTPGAAGAGTVSVWVNPAASSFGGAEPTPDFSNIPGGNAAAIASVFIRSGAGTNPMLFDELRVGSSWPEVTPAIILPVSLTHLKLTTNNNVSAISWRSNTEINFDKYVVLYSNNGTDFKEIGMVKGKGSNSQYSFRYMHYGEGFFKLKLVDTDGRFVYSEVLHTSQKALKVRLGPNPLSDRLYISGMPEGQNTIVIYNVAGAIIKSMIVNNDSGNIPVSMLANGTYFLRIINKGTTVYNSRLIKK